jgi:curved DNA-binding protein CbpA
LGANPKDTQGQLKIRYQTLAKKLHPDSNPDRDVINYYYSLPEINAAWEVLKDPAERKRYDRSLQTKEITEGIESFVTMGIESFVTTGIPFLKKTAATTAAAVDASTKAAKEANKQAQKAAKEANVKAQKTYGAFEIDQQIKVLEQKSNADSARASKIQKDLDALPSKKIASLERKPSLKQQQQQQEPLSSVEAQRILKNFQTSTTGMKPPPASLSNDIKMLTDSENKQKDDLRACQSFERNVRMAERKVEQARRAEEMAQKRLEEAQLAFKEAKQNHLNAQDGDRKAKAEERLALQSSTKIDSMLQRTSEKVRIGLLQQQDVFLVSRANELKKEKLECETSSKKSLKEAKALRIKADKIEKKR